MPRKAMEKKRSTPKRIVNNKESAKVISETVEQFKRLTIADKQKCLMKLDVGKDFFICNECGEVKAKDGFYLSSDPNCKTGVTSICKECATKIASSGGDNGNEVTRGSVARALRIMNKPFIEKIWEAALAESSTAGRRDRTRSGSTPWTAYIKNVQLPYYKGLTYNDSDVFKDGKTSIELMIDDALPKDKEIVMQYEKNKADVLRLLGYEPFDKEKLSDQPFLYSQLVGFLDASEQGNDDMMRTSSIISIVRGFLQLAQLDDMIANLVKDPDNAERNIAQIKSMQEMKKNITITISKLAEDSCISLKNNKNAVKGENTWTGKIRKLKEMNLRESDNNGFDMKTCRGMQQVQEISDASIMKQLALDESEWSDMVAEMREKIIKLQNEKDSYQEINRLLLKENLDLKETLNENKVDISKDIVDLKAVYSTFSESEEVDDN